MTSLLLLPGTLCDERLFSHQVEQLSALADVRVGDLTTADTIEGMAESVLDAAPEKFALGGLSLGGIVALEVVRVAPQRVTHLALLDTNHTPPTKAQVATWTVFEQMTLDGDFDRITPERLAPILIHRQEDRRLRQLVLDMAAAIGPEAFLRQNHANSHRPDNSGVLGQIECPTLVLCGAEDAVCPVVLHEEIAARISGAELAIVPAAGHLSTIDAPEAVTAALRSWLARPAHTTDTKQD
ncbi:MAG: alpha/beta hydrolase [Actinomycetota bacterium]|nr:alpha/beta hydrolase [Actinomycetota bacterium]